MSSGQVPKPGDIAEIEIYPDLLDSSLVAITGGGPELIGTKCVRCGQKMLGKRIVCSSCLSADVQAVALEKEGTLYSCTKLHVMVGREAPVWIGYVDLDDGVRTLTELDGGRVPQIGDRVVLRADAEGRWWFTGRVDEGDL